MGLVNRRSFLKANGLIAQLTINYLLLTNLLNVIQDHTQHLGVLTVSIHIPNAQSLKEKRFVLKSLKDKLRRNFNVSVAELDGQDKW